MKQAILVPAILLFGGWVLAAVILAGCSPLDTWNTPKVGYVDSHSRCPRYMHRVRGPDAYDVAHGQPYHCEAPPFDSQFSDIDAVDQ